MDFEGKSAKSSEEEAIKNGQNTSDDLLGDICAALGENLDDIPSSTPPINLECNSLDYMNDEILKQSNLDELEKELNSLGIRSDESNGSGQKNMRSDGTPDQLFQTVHLTNSSVDVSLTQTEPAGKSENQSLMEAVDESAQPQPVNPDTSSRPRFGVAGRGSESTSNELKLRVLRDVHNFQPKTYKAPCFCDICGKVMLGLWQQGQRCSICHMDVHAECRVALVTPDHQCRRPQHINVHEEAPEVVLNSRPPIPPTNPQQEGTSIPEEVEDPVHSEWHQRLKSRNEQWVPDSVAPACMTCGELFGLIRRRHHCRRCGACVCSSCSNSRVSDKILSIDAGTGSVQLVPATGEPVRTCIRCTQVIDSSIRRALKQQGWGHRKKSQSD